MKLSAKFQNGGCELSMIPEDAWEESLVGTIAKGGNRLDAIVEYEPKGHFSYGNAKAVRVILCPPADPTP